MKIVVTSVLVDDQEKALRFYTDVLGFEKKQDVPMGEFRWLTVVSPQDPNGTRTASRTPHSVSTTSRPTSSGSPAAVCASPNRRPRWVR